jgi:hypothetical protein
MKIVTKGLQVEGVVLVCTSDCTCTVEMSFAAGDVVRDAAIIAALVKQGARSRSCRWNE